MITDDPAPVWSVVVITKNEAAKIELCLRSIIDSLAGQVYELLLVDSASTDGTPDLARKFPTEVVVLSPDLHLHPSVGRHVGYLHSRGQFLLFIDGDSVLHKGWLEAAAEAFRDPRVGGLAGVRIEVLVDAEGNEVRSRDPYADRPEEPTAALYLGGPAAYRRQVFDEVGGFNPFMCVQEEQELGSRIRAAGYVLRRLPVRMTTHYVETEPETLSWMIRRVRRGYPMGLGQLARYGLHQGHFEELHFRDVRRHLQFWLLMLLGLPGVLQWILAGEMLLFWLWLGLCGVGFLAFCWKTRGFRRPLYYVAEWLIFGPIALWGFLLPPRPASKYPYPSPRVSSFGHGR